MNPSPIRLRYAISPDIGTRPLLTANPFVLEHPLVGKLGAKYKKTATQIVFRFSQQLGIVPLTGTSSPSHMKEDLNAESFQLDESELEALETIAA